MKKFFFLSALLCASMMVFAVDEDTWIPVNADGAAFANQFKWYSVDGASSPSNVVEIQKPGFATEVGIYVTFPDAGFNAVYYNDVLVTNGTEYKQDGAGIAFYVSALTQKNTTILIKNNETIRFGLRIYNDKGTSTGLEKADPTLSLNETAVTLSAEAPVETFQIVPTQAGDGAISYESANAGIASVSSTGLVTAVGRGTTTISVKVAETDTYAAATKKLTITVTGPVNWTAIEWLAGGNDKYKVVAEPEIGSQFGGKHIENNNLWIGFPSAAFGENSSVEHSAIGAGVSFPLSQFPNKFNEFDFVCDNVTYHITLYYVDGMDSTTAIEENKATVKTHKMVENGMLIIEKNGIRYNVLGSKL